MKNIVKEKTYGHALYEFCINKNLTNWFVDYNQNYSE